MATVLLGCTLTMVVANLFIWPAAYALLAARVVTVQAPVLAPAPPPLAVAMGTASLANV